MRPSPAVTPAYSKEAAWVHWLTVAGVLFALASGLYMVELSMSLLKLKLFNWHKWAGISVLAATLVRIAWRVGNVPPPFEQPAALQRAASAAHGALYLLLLATPLLGWAYSSAAGFPIMLFGVIPLPDWVARERELAEFLKPLHRLCAHALLALLVIHVAAVLKHQLIDRRQVLQRMRPW